MSNFVQIHTRHLQLVNTDPQRRCYNGCHFKSELVWTPWELLEHVKEDNLETRLAFWKDLNDYAVSRRGKEAKREFKVERLNA